MDYKNYKKKRKKLMEKTKAKKSGWPILGTIRKNDNGSYIKFNDDVTILVDGDPIDMNKSRTASLQSPVDKTERLIKAGFIKEEDVESSREKAQDINSWLKYEIVIPPPKDNDL